MKEREWFPGVELGEILISAAQIRQRIGKLGAEISRDYTGLESRLIGILEGVVPFMADLIRAISIPVTTDYMSIQKYHPESEDIAAVRLLKDLDLSIAGEHVLLVEDIVDSGLTTEYILAQVRNRGPAGLRASTAFNKPGNRVVDLPLEYIGFDLPDAFFVGYGLDYHQKYRNLPHLAVLKTHTDADRTEGGQLLAR